MMWLLRFLPDPVHLSCHTVESHHSHLSAGAQGLKPLSVDFPGHYLGTGSGAEQPGLKPVFQYGILVLQAEV